MSWEKLPDRLATIDPLGTTDGNYTLVTVEIGKLHGMGVAKKHPEDIFDAQIGYDFALSRALEDVANQLREEAL